MLESLQSQRREGAFRRSAPFIRCFDALRSSFTAPPCARTRVKGIQLDAGISIVTKAIIVAQDILGSPLLLWWWTGRMRRRGS